MGSPRAWGVQEHGDQLADLGIPTEELPEFLMQVVSEGVQVAMQRTRPVLRVRYRGQDWHVAINIGDNGSVVGVNPVGQRKLRQLLRRQSGSENSSNR